jgi:hypothetical protein
VTAFETANKNNNLDVIFLPMPINEGMLTFTDLKPNNENGYPIATSIHVHGVPSLGANDGNRTKPFSNDQCSRDIVFGAAAGFEMGINMFGACQIVGRLGYPSDLNRITGLSGLISGTNTYKYQLAVTRKITIKYNEKQLYCILRKQSVNNGLFRSSSANEVSQSSNLSQWLDISAVTEDSDADFVDRDKLLIDLRKEMLDHALISVAKSYLTSEQANLLAPGKIKGPETASDLQKCENIFCQVGAFALDLGNALFGGTDSTSDSCSDVGAMSEQNLEDVKTVPAFGTQGFNVKESY